MPIYEFYCPDCHTIFNFFSKTVNTDMRPLCPRCKKRKLERQISLFAAVGSAKEGEEGEDLPFDETRMQQAMASLASEAEGMNEEDPRQAARLMRKMSEMTGMGFGPSIEEALSRMESGEDPQKIEQEMGDLLESEENPFLMPGAKGGSGSSRPPPQRDEKLYEL